MNVEFHARIRENRALAEIPHWEGGPGSKSSRRLLLVWLGTTG